MSTVTKKKDKTILKFKFCKATGFRLGHRDWEESWGNFSPQLETVLMPLEKHPGVAGNVFEYGYDFNREYEIELPSEVVRDLPEYIAEHADEEVRKSYKTKQAEEAANQHKKNNYVRDELAELEAKGVIKVTYDSFFAASKIVKVKSLDEGTIAETQTKGKK